MDLNIYKTKRGGISAMKRQALGMMNYEVVHHCSAAGNGFVVEVYVNDSEDADEIRARGFIAVIDTDKAADY